MCKVERALFVPPALRPAAYMHAGQYDKSWEDVHFIESRGISMKPEFMAELRRLSGRER